MLKKKLQLSHQKQKVEVKFKIDLSTRIMALFIASHCRSIRSSILCQRFYLKSSRWLSTETRNSPDVSQNISQQKEKQTNNNQSSSSGPKKSRYRTYFLSIAAGALIGTAYAFRKSQQYEGLMPEYMSNPEYFERQAMEARPVPPPVTKRVTFDKPPRVHFPFKVTLYQFVTW